MLRLIILIVVAIAIFLIAKWGIPLVFAELGVNIPETVAAAMAILVAIGITYAGRGYVPTA